MHLSALRRDLSEVSSDMCVSFGGLAKERTVDRGFYSTVSARRWHLRRAAAAPARATRPSRYPTRRNTADSRPARRRRGSRCGWSAPAKLCLSGHPGEHVDDVRAMLVDHDRGALMIEVVGTSADQPIALRREVGHHRRDVHVAGKPGLDRVPVGGDDVRQVLGHQRAHVGGNDIVEQRIGRRGRQEQECEAGGERRADAAERSQPEWPRAPGGRPGPAASRARLRRGGGGSCGGRLLIEHARDRAPAAAAAPAGIRARGGCGHAVR